jgi:hypothetical protein
LHLKALAAGAAAALTLAGAASAGTHRAPAHIRVAVAAKHHVSVSIQKAGSSNGVVAGGFLGAAVTYLGVDRATIVAGLKSGQSLAQIATAHQKTADGLVAALLAPAKLKLDAAVTAGKLTSDRESAILARLQTALAAVVAKTVTPQTPKTHTASKVRVNPAVILQATTSYLGVDLKTIVKGLRSGKTLADIAVAQNKTADGLTAAIVAAVKAKLDPQVAAARITQQQETDFLTQLQTSATAFVTGSHS